MRLWRRELTAIQLIAREGLIGHPQLEEPAKCASEGLLGYPQLVVKESSL
jgi:hypothetical protein